MTDEASGPDFAAAVPDLLYRMWSSAGTSPQEVRAAVAASGLTASRFWESDSHRSVSVTFDSKTATAAAERKIRTAVTRSIGRPSGSDKRWDIDTFLVSLSVRDGSISVFLHGRYPLARARSAAVAWLGGQDATSWSEEFGFIDDQRNAGTYFRPGGEGTPATASISLPASTHPVGTVPSSDEESYQMTVDYLSDQLGAAGPGSTAVSPFLFSWHRGTRTVDIRRSRGTRSRSIGFLDEP